MYNEKVTEAMEMCYTAIKDVYKLKEEICNAIGEMNENSLYKDGFCFEEFEKTVAKASARKILEEDFYISNDCTMERLWIENAVQTATDFINPVSFFGNRFRITVEDFDCYRPFYNFVSEDGREDGSGDIEDVQEKIKRIIAEDVLRITTGATLTRKNYYTKEEYEELEEERLITDIINEFALNFGNNYLCGEFPYSDVKAILENTASAEVIEKVVEIYEELKTLHNVTVVTV